MKNAATLNEQSTALRATLREKGRLTKHDPAILEAELKQTPDNIVNRARLIAYYFGRHDQRSLKAHCKHVLWLIDHHPDHAVCNEPYTYLYDELFKTGREHWQKQLQLQPDSVPVLANAAGFLMTSKDLDLFYSGVDLLVQACELDAKEPEWTRILINKLWNKLCYTSDAVNKRRLAKGVVEFGDRRLILDDQDAMDKWYVLAYMAHSSLLLGDFEEARKYTDQFGKQAARFPNSNNHANFERSIAGLLSLRNQDIESAKKSLLGCGIYNATFQLMWELSQAGAVETVLAFIDQCAKTGYLMKEWKNSLEKGVIPDFCAERVVGPI